MNKAKQSNRSLIISIISIVACVVLLIGATMAWFTDTETNTGNRIEAGTLDAKLYKWTGDTFAELSADNTTTAPTNTPDNTNTNKWAQITDDTMADYIFDFDSENWKPGDTKTIYLAVQNAGSLAFAYDLDLVVEDKALADALQVSITSAPSDIPTDSATYQTISSLADADVDSLYPIQDSELAKEAIDYIQIDIKLDASTGDSYQDLVFAMDLVLTATQAEEENTVVKAYDSADITSLTTADADKTVILMNDIVCTTAVEIPTNVNIDLNGYQLTAPTFKMENLTDYCTVDIVNGVIVATGAFEGDYSDYGVLIHMPNGTINMDDTIVASEKGVTIDASTNTLNLTGTTQFVGVTTDDTGSVPDTDETTTVKIEANTRVVVATTANTAIEVSNDVAVEDGRSDTTEDGTEVTNGTITVTVPENTTGVEITNTDDTTNSISTTGDTSDTLVDGAAVPTTASASTAAEFTTAVSQAEDGVEHIITLGSTFSGYCTISANNKNITIDLNGYTLSTGIKIDGDGNTITIIDSNPNLYTWGDSKQYYRFNNDGGTVTFSDNAQNNDLILEFCCVEKITNITATNSVTNNAGEINNSSSNINGIECVGGTVTLNAGKVTTSGAYAMAVYCTSGTVTVNYCYFSGSGNPSNIFYCTNGEIIVYDCSVGYCNNGSDCVLEGSGSITLYGGTYYGYTFKSFIADGYTDSGKTIIPA